MNRKRSSFSGKLGFVLSAAGASVGLGNIWRFPYLAAKYGGGIFLLVYIILALTFGYTMIVFKKSAILKHLHSYILLFQILNRSLNIFFLPAGDCYGTADRCVLNDLQVRKDDI